MARTKQTARKTTVGKVPKKQLHPVYGIKKPVTAGKPAIPLNPKKASMDDVVKMMMGVRGKGISKAAKRVVKKMAPRNSVTGASALDQTGGRLGRIPRDKRHSKKHPGFKAVARKISRRQHIPLEQADAELAAATRRHMGGSLVNKLPQESGIANSRERKRKAEVTDPHDLKLDPRLRDAVAMTQANSPLDPENRESLSNLPTHHRKLLKNAAGFRKARSLSSSKKGGYIFTTLRNVTVEPKENE